jgi:hypothetical protein
METTGMHAFILFLLRSGSVGYVPGAMAWYNDENNKKID